MRRWAPPCCCDPQRSPGWSAARGDAPSDVVARVLGGRQLLQGIALIIRPDPPVVTVAVATDVLHAASMLLLGWIRPGYRRPALVSAAIAAASAGCGAIILRGGHR